MRIQVYVRTWKSGALRCTLTLSIVANASSADRIVAGSALKGIGAVIAEANDSVNEPPSMTFPCCTVLTATFALFGFNSVVGMSTVNCGTLPIAAAKVMSCINQIKHEQRV
jgi:hypothetical protein